MDNLYELLDYPVIPKKEIQTISELQNELENRKKKLSRLRNGNLLISRINAWKEAELEQYEQAYQDLFQKVQLEIKEFLQYYKTGIFGDELEKLAKEKKVTVAYIKDHYNLTILQDSEKEKWIEYSSKEPVVFERDIEELKIPACYERVRGAKRELNLLEKEDLYQFLSDYGQTTASLEHQTPEYLLEISNHLLNLFQADTAEKSAAERIIVICKYVFQNEETKKDYDYYLWYSKIQNQLILIKKLAIQNVLEKKRGERIIHNLNLLLQNKSHAIQLLRGYCKNNKIIWLEHMERRAVDIVEEIVHKEPIHAEIISETKKQKQPQEQLININSAINEKKSEESPFSWQEDVQSDQNPTSKKKHRIKIVVAFALAGLVIAIIVGFLRPYFVYQNALNKAKNGDIEEANALFSGIKSYKDAKEMLKGKSVYLYAEALEKNGSTREACDYLSNGYLADFDSLQDAYQPCVELCQKLTDELYYDYCEKGDGFLVEEDFDHAIQAYHNANEYGNAEEYLYKVNCAEAEYYLRLSQYEKAIACYEEANHYGEATKNILAAYNQYAEKLRADGNYTNAINIYQRASRYGVDNTVLIQQCLYQYAEKFKAEGNYIGAILQYQKGSEYGIDTSVAIWECMYEYVRKNLSLKNATTLDYLKQLSAANYMDSRAIYNQLTEWKITNVYMNDSHDSNTAMNSVQSDTGKPAVVHFTLSGGKEDEKLNLRFEALAENNAHYWTWSGNPDISYSSSIGEIEHSHGYKLDNMDTSSGAYKFICKIYNADTNQLMATATINIT